MEINILHSNEKRIAEIVSSNVVISNTQDALDIIGNMYNYADIDAIIVHEKNIIPNFFDLKTGIAGDILQKFTQYYLRLAIIGNFDKYQSKSLNDFIYESNKAGKIIFVDTVDKAKEVFTVNN